MSLVSRAILVSAAIVAVVLSGASPALAASAQGGHVAITSNQRHFLVLSSPATLDVRVRYRCSGGEGELSVSLAQWQYSGVGTAIPDPQNLAQVALYTNTGTPFSPATPFISTCDGRRHTDVVTIPLMPSAPFVRGLALLTLINMSEARTVVDQQNLVVKVG